LARSRASISTVLPRPISSHRKPPVETGGRPFTKVKLALINSLKQGGDKAAGELGVCGLAGGKGGGVCGGEGQVYISSHKKPPVETKGVG
jgi:hypothetical protein